MAKADSVIEILYASGSSLDRRGKAHIAEKCALNSYDAMQVRFLSQQSVVVSLTLTALSERTGWEAKGKGET